MRSTTETALLALGSIPTLSGKIAHNLDTLSSLRAKSDAALRQSYVTDEVQLIKENIKRKPIDPDVLDRVISAADGACCYCDNPEPEEIWNDENVKAIQDRFAALDASGEDYVVDERAEEEAATPTQ